jgi:hypothetical protein
MWRFLPVCVGWLILEVILLRGAAAFLPDGPFLLRSSDTVPAFARADLDSGEVLFKETFSVSQELTLLCKQENKQSRSLAPSVDSLPPVQERDDRWSFVRTKVAPLVTLFFFPRKLPSPSAEDGLLPS